MKSEILQQADFCDCVRDWQWNAQPDEAKAEKQLRQVALKYRKYEKAPEVLPGDVVEAEMHSACPKFNRTAKISVGLGLFDKKFEEELLGKPQGFAGTYAGEGGVSYRILDITRVIIPVLSDGMAAAEGLGVNTVRQLKNHYLVQEMREKLISEAYAFVKHYVTLCEYRIDEGEIDEMCDAEMARCRDISKGMGMVFDEMTEEQLLGAVGCKSIDEFQVMICDLFHLTMRGALAYAAVSGEYLAGTEAVSEYYYKLIECAADLAAQQKIDKEDAA